MGHRSQIFSSRNNNQVASVLNMMFAIQMLTHVSKNVASFGISEAERWSYVMGWVSIACWVIVYSS